MSKNLMSTEPGGESDQYSTINTVNQPHNTSTGQLSQASSDPKSAPSHSLDPSQTKAHQERGERTAENIRYGQGISEQGMGGQTTTSSGSAGHEGGYGGTRDEGASAGQGQATERAKQGFGGKGESSDEIGG